MAVVVGSVSLTSSRKIIGEYARENLLMSIREQAYKLEEEIINGFDENIQKNIRNIKMYETGYISLINNDYDFIIHPVFTEKDNLKTVESGILLNVANQMKEQQEGVITYTYKGQEKILGYYKLSNGYILMGNIISDEVFKQLNTITITLISVVLIGMLIAIIIAFYTSNKIAKPITKTIELIDKTSRFDLVYDNSFEELLKNKDETGVMVKALDSMRVILRDMVVDITDKAKNIANYSNNLSDTMNETSASVQEVASATDELAHGASEQAKNTQDGLDRLNSLAEKINIALDSSKDIEVYIGNITQVSEEGSKSINNLKLAVKNNNQIAEEVKQEVEELDIKSNSINKVTNTIKTIADQTNLLALNAAIEAARAGEHGKGFAVVANEIRKLANEVSINAKEIETTVVEIKEKIVNTKNKVYDSKEVINQITEETKINELSFFNIEQAIKSIIEKTKVLISNIESVNQDKNSVILTIEQISAITQQTAASTEEVAASIQQQSSSVEEITNTSYELKQIAKDLNIIIERFTV